MDQNNGERRRRRPPESRPVQRRRRKKKKKNIIPAIIIGIIGVVIIALIIMGLKTILSGPKDESISESELTSEVDPTASVSPEPSPEPTGTPVPTPAEEADISGLEVYDELSNMVVVGESGYDYYKFNNDIATEYINNINAAYTELGGSANMYEMIIPSSIDIMLPLSFLNNYAEQSSDQAKASTYINGSLNQGIKTVPLYDEFKAHCDEKLYFSTDYHWTGLAAYYAYSQWAYTKGIDAIPLSSFEKAESDNFTGWFYIFSGLERLNYGETVEYYMPDMDMSYQYSDNSDGSDMVDGTVFVDILDDFPDAKFKTFLNGPHSYSVITNNDVTDGSSCVLVIDSNGTALAPYIATAYNKTYIIDYRTYSGSVAQVAKDNGASDVIWCTSISTTADEEYTAAIAGVK